MYSQLRPEAAHQANDDFWMCSRKIAREDGVLHPEDHRGAAQAPGRGPRNDHLRRELRAAHAAEGR
eukprot:4608398-Alexandrium_andersonii.AAC.1